MKTFLLNNGSIVVLILLCTYYSIATIDVHHPVTPDAGEAVAASILADGTGSRVLICTRDGRQHRAFAQAVRVSLESSGSRVAGIVHGSPTDIAGALRLAGQEQRVVTAIATNQTSSIRGPLEAKRIEKLRNEYPSFQDVKVYKPQSYSWPSFLTRSNISNVIDHSAEIAIIAIGMTLVIITAGIDLSVGSLLAVSGVTAAVAVHHLGAGAGGLLGGALLGIGACLLCGIFNGVMVTYFQVPAFVVTLSVMMIARGLALIIAVQHQSALLGGGTEGTPEAVAVAQPAWGWLGGGASFGISNPILLMVSLYVTAHLVMTRTSFGRYVYAVGGNREAARLSGVPVFAVLIAVYALCGALAGLAGIVDASRHLGGRPNAGELYELRVIAAVVVGGTSLAGGEGRIFGTLIGALIIAVINNGLNMAGVASYEQKVVFGILILAAVLLDRFKKQS